MTTLHSMSTKRNFSINVESQQGIKFPHFGFYAMSTLHPPFKSHLITTGISTDEATDTRITFDERPKLNIFSLII